MPKLSTMTFFFGGLTLLLTGPKIPYGLPPIELLDSDSVLYESIRIFSWYSDFCLGLMPRNSFVLSLMLSNIDFSEGVFSLFYSAVITDLALSLVAGNLVGLVAYFWQVVFTGRGIVRLATRDGTLFDRVLGLSYLSTKLMLWVWALVVVWGLLDVGGRYTLSWCGDLLVLTAMSPERGGTGVFLPLPLTRPLGLTLG